METISEHLMFCQSETHIDMLTKSLRPLVVLDSYEILPMTSIQGSPITINTISSST